MNHPFDVIVVGGGVLGLSVSLACALRDKNLQIAIIDDGRAAASTAAGAMLGCFAEVTPESARHPAVQRKQELAVAAARSWPDWYGEVADRASGCQVHFGQGTHVVLNTHSGAIDDEAFDAIVRTLERYTEPYETVAPSDIPGYDPACRGRSLRSIFIPSESYLDARAWLSALILASESTANVTRLLGRVETVTARPGGGADLVTSDEMTYCADVAVISAGVATHRLFNKMPDIQRRLPPMFAGNGTALELRGHGAGLETVVRTPNRSFACGLHAVPQQSGALYIGATNSPGTDETANANTGDLHFLLSCAILQISRRLQRSSVVRLHSGARPIPLDTLPMIGETSAPGVWVATGTYRDGIHLSPLVAQTLAADIVDGSSSLEPLYAPERPLINTWQLQDALDHAQQHYMAAIHERETVNSAAWEREALERWVREAIEAVYRELANTESGQFVLPPDFIAGLVENPKETETFGQRIQANASAWAASEPRPSA